MSWFRSAARAAQRAPSFSRPAASRSFAGGNPGVAFADGASSRSAWAPGRRAAGRAARAEQSAAARLTSARVARIGCVSADVLHGLQAIFDSDEDDDGT
mmetsp:Transcript_15897/g.29099  ORF Transcript_15897/g.29099 Transcript_15897/m.29099 type:complete len:99 (-) Transcript_15897:490-786(-)|eukprot:CAMPEP_0184524520 /NCGR_PEP_ID=MMETSP0198_2-20121128/9568_1 /TAXON_ID=1112570 /ORGANISM="Thraustochytrium sp., Strain LLF1b" /LENGTH=98 /DNA_ID=CAMNT_0026915837 /DNA_START=57 /DNA_END=353 /DNA_ORIENTATION=-